MRHEYNRHHQDVPSPSESTADIAANDLDGVEETDEDKPREEEKAFMRRLDGILMLVTLPRVKHPADRWK